MNWLSIDTCTSTLSVGLVREEVIVGEWVSHLKRQHSKHLLPAVEGLLRQTGRAISDIGGIAVTQGPGSYTGVRIGVTTAKVLAWSLALPLVGVSSLAALAVNGRRFSGHLIPMWDARRKRVYTGHYRFDSHSQLTVLREDRVLGIQDLMADLADVSEPLLFLGDGAVQYRPLIEAQLGDQAVFAETAENVIRPASVVRLAIQEWRRRGSDEIESFSPKYLQVTEAEANWLKRQQAGEKRF